jgi:hypothetical protein
VPKVSEVCHLRSKNAGPFWITIDFFFNDCETFVQYADSPQLHAAAVAPLLGANPDAIKRFPVPELAVLKLSYPRAAPQGGVIERDMHGGQQYARLLDVEVQ